MHSVQEQIQYFIQRKGRIHLSGIIGRLHWIEPQLIVETLEKMLIEDQLNGEYIKGHWYFIPKVEIKEPKKIYAGFLYPTKSVGCDDVLDTMQEVEVTYHGNDQMVRTKDGKVDFYLNTQLKLEAGKTMKCNMAYDYRGRFYFLDWINPALQTEVREQFTFTDGSKIHWIDASASGIQQFTALSRCKVSAKACNLINTGKQQDPYMEVAHAFNKTREQVKRPLMTHMYGSTKQPEITFGEDVTEFYAACEKALPGAYEINLAMLLLHKAFNKQALEWFWELPDGFQVNAPVFVTEFISMEATILEMPCEMTIGFRRNQPNKTNKSMSANLAHSIDSFVMREMIRLATCNRTWLDEVIEQAGTKEGTCQRMDYLSLVHVKDAGIQDLDGLLEIQCLLSTMEPFQIIPIHDCCGVKEKYIEDVQRLYRFVIGKLVASSYPEYLKDAFGVTWSDGDLKEQDVLESRFALCEE